MSNISLLKSGCKYNLSFLCLENWLPHKKKLGLFDTKPGVKINYETMLMAKPSKLKNPQAWAHCQTKIVSPHPNK